MYSVHAYGNFKWALEWHRLFWYSMRSSGSLGGGYYLSLSLHTELLGHMENACMDVIPAILGKERWDALQCIWKQSKLSSWTPRLGCFVSSDWALMPFLFLHIKKKVGKKVYYVMPSSKRGGTLQLLCFDQRLQGTAKQSTCCWHKYPR